MFLCFQRFLCILEKSYDFLFLNPCTQKSDKKHGKHVACVKVSVLKKHTAHIIVPSRSNVFVYVKLQQPQIGWFVEYTQYFYVARIMNAVRGPFKKGHFLLGEHQQSNGRDHLLEDLSGINKQQKRTRKRRTTGQPH